VNVPSVDPEVLKGMKPFLELAEKIGSMQAQIVSGYIKTVKITYVGDLIKQNLTALTLSIVKGLLTPILEEKVNYVNALVIAKERGIEVVERKTDKVEDFAHLIHVNVETSETKSSVMGTLFTNSESRIVKIDNFYVEAMPKGHMLVIYNHDMPGIVGNIGTLLGDAGINIAGMTFGREKKGGDAITLLNIDSAVPQPFLKR
jgi:D-3-phosphoglycerate dehydrogenase